MAGKSSGDRRKPIRKGKDGKNAAPAKAIRVGVIDYKDVATLRKFISERSTALTRSHMRAPKHGRARARLRSRSIFAAFGGEPQNLDLGHYH